MRSEGGREGREMRSESGLLNVGKGSNSKKDRQRGRDFRWDLCQQGRRERER